MSKTTVEIVGKESVSDAAGKAANASKQLGNATGGLVRSFTDLTVAGAVVMGAISKIGAAVADVSREWAEQEKALVTFNAAMAQTGKINAEGARGLREFAESMASLTGESDEAILALESMLATAGRSETEIRKIITAAADYSAGSGKSFQSAVEQLNKSFGGLAGELGESIPEIRNLTRAELENGGAVDAIAKKYAGLSGQLAETTDVQLKNLKNSWSDFKESLGANLAPVFNPLLGYIQKVIDKWTGVFNESKRAMDALASGDMELADALMDRKGIQSRIDATKGKIKSDAAAGLLTTAGDEQLRSLMYELVAVNLRIEAAQKKKDEEAATKKAAAVVAAAVAAPAPAAASAAAAEPDGLFFTTPYGAGGTDLAAPVEKLSLAIVEAQGKLGDLNAESFSFGAAWTNALEKISAKFTGWNNMVSGIIQTIASGLGRALESVGAALFNQESAWDNLGKIALDVLSQVLRGIGAQLAGLAAVHLLSLDFVGAGIAAAASAAAFIAAGAVSAWSASISPSQSSASASTSSPGYSTSQSGSSASYSKPRDITVNVQLNTPAMVGEGGFREFCVMVGREMKSAGVLGMA